MPQQNSKPYQVPSEKDANFVNHPGAADIMIQPKSPKFLLDMRYFCNFSLVSLGIRPRSRRCVERTRQGEGRWSRPPKAALERSYIRSRVPVPRIAYFGRDKKKLLTKSLAPKKDFIYIFICTTRSHIVQHCCTKNMSSQRRFKVQHELQYCTALRNSNYKPSTSNCCTLSSRLHSTLESFRMHTAFKYM